MNSLKTGRNDPCPCGSPNKFKKCCLKLPQFQRKATYRFMDHSRYMPHQGKRECERRRLGGFGWIMKAKREGFIFDHDHGGCRRTNADGSYEVFAFAK